MSLEPGTRFGSYEIVALIGAGGMGEVYRGRDIALNRDVAVKVLPAAVASDPDRLARFEREAQALAALNHPNIAHIYGLERSGQAPAIIMEFVDGEDLSARIRRGPVPVGEALPLARQLAEALVAAHEAGIIHRDLKPANVKVTNDGTVKVLDFGLAKALDLAAPPGSAQAANSPTLTARATQLGVILGTAAYMAPEQARGKVVDKRADIWAFGVVLYEMLAGRRPFEADDASDVLALVLTKDVDWTPLPPATPPLIHRLLLRCLMKDPKQRLHDIADARLEIEEAIASRSRQVEEGPSEGGGRLSRRRLMWLLVGGALVFTGGVAAGVLGFQRAPTSALPVFAAIPVLPAESVDSGPADDKLSASGLSLAVGGANSALAWSPDGQSLAYVGVEGGRRQVYIRELSSRTGRALEGTSGARSLAFSRTGDWIAFANGREIQKVGVAGGPAIPISTVHPVNGISWGDAVVAYADARAIFVVSPDGGGSPQQVTTPAAEFVRHASPFLLPGDSAVLYTEHARRWTSGDERVMVQALGPDGEPEGQPEVLIPNGADARYLPTGHLAFMRQGTLVVVPFDLASRKVRGEQVPIQDGIVQVVMSGLSQDLTLAGQFAISPQGTLAYISGSLPTQVLSELVAVDRQGGVTPLGAEPSTYGPISASKNGRLLATSTRTRDAFRLQFFDMGRRSLSSDPSGIRGEPVGGAFSSNGYVAVEAYEGGISSLTIARVDGSEPPLAVKDSSGFRPTDWLSDGRILVGTRNGDIWVYSAEPAPGKLSEFARIVPYVEEHPTFSPDGRWLAYSSNESGSGVEIYVRPYPGPGPRVLVSRNGGSSPAWNPRGRELFFTSPVSRNGYDRRMMRVDMTNPAQPGEPQELFPFSQAVLGFEASPNRGYGVSPDGQEFYIRRILPFTRPRVTHVNVVFNWFEEVRNAVQSGR